MRRKFFNFPGGLRPHGSPLGGPRGEPQAGTAGGVPRGPAPGASARGQRQGPAPGASAKGAGSWGSPGGLIGPHGAFCHFIVERWCYPEAPGRLRGARGRVMTPTPRAGKKTRATFPRFFFCFGGVRGVVWGVPPGSPGFPGGPGEPRGAQGSPGGAQGPILLKIRFF